MGKWCPAKMLFRGQADVRAGRSEDVAPRFAGGRSYFAAALTISMRGPNSYASAARSPAMYRVR